MTTPTGAPPPRRDPSLASRVALVRELFGPAPAGSDDASERSRRRYRGIVLAAATAVVARALGALGSLVGVRIVLDVYGRELFGLFSTVTAVGAWMTLFDFGVLNGLLNALSAAQGRDDERATNELVSTAAYLLVAFTIALGLGFALVYPWIDWATLLGAERGDAARLVAPTVLAAALPLFVALPLTVVRQIFAALQRAWANNVIQAGAAVVTLGVTMVAARAGLELPWFVLATGAVVPLAGAIGLARLRAVELDSLRLSPRHVTRAAARRLLDSSVPLFLFQLGALLVNETQMIVLARRAGLGVVADYAVVSRFSMLASSLVTMTTAAFVPTFREAHERGDAAWMRTAFRRMLATRMALALAVSLVVVGGAEPLLALWLGAKAPALGLATRGVLAAAIIAATWVTAYSELLLVLDRIWLQVGLVLLNGLVSVAAVWALAPALGVLGALLGTATVTVVAYSWLLPWLARPVLARRVGRPPTSTA